VRWNLDYAQANDRKQAAALFRPVRYAIIKKSEVFMKSMRCRLLVLALMLLPMVARAHTPLFDCYDNGDETLTCEGGFTDGASAEGVDIRVVDVQGKVLEQGRLDAAGSITFTRPAGEFSVVFSAGSEHSITVLGDDIL
jgi:hypothetical protein